MGLPEGWVTAVPGLSRNEQIKLLGNGVVPQQCAAAIRGLLQMVERALSEYITQPPPPSAAARE